MKINPVIFWLYTGLWVLASIEPLFPGEPATERVPPPPPYTFNLGGLSKSEVDGLSKVPGVVEVVRSEERLKVTWQPFNDAPWTNPGDKWIPGADRIYDYLAIKGKLGKTKWSHGKGIIGRAGTIISQTRGQVSFGMMFNDLSKGTNEMMALRCYDQASLGQVEHEMLRDVAGTPVKTEKCGDGYVVVSGAGRGVFVVWQVSDQMFVRIDNSFDKEMVAAYVNRLGSIIPSDYQVNADKWVEDEIRWRIPQINHAYEWEKANKQDFVFIFCPFVTMYFPDVYRKYGILEAKTPLEKTWTWMNNCRNFLWANRANFKYDDGTRGYVLKSADRYDAKNPPELPDELKGPPKPAEAPPAPKAP